MEMEEVICRIIAEILDRPRSGRPTDCNDEDLRDAIREKPSATTCELSMTLGCDRTSIIRHLQALGCRKLVPTWVSHELNSSQLAARVSVCESLLLRPHRRDFLRQIVTGDESWVLYVNHIRQKSWLPRGEPPPKEPNGELHGRTA
ncbi:hypothetical protein Y032_0002g785 [Ancylostoma ceylanicum]|uniref:Histone-lysine N-methyltransferase SETMAR n=1 Tax=Ancylostoma ceylanicum TaxID=53326 RepID=A0A016W297_9BILA|nr:hypothetical protein Y032_0002g785 [Ancylostoma ceylanicum]